MAYPLIFFDLSKELDKRVCFDFLDIKAGGIDFGGGIIKAHPELEAALSKNENVAKEIISSYVNEYYQTHRAEMKRVLVKTKSSWKKNDRVFYAKVSRIFENHPWPPGRYYCHLSIFNINPRFLESKTFQVFYLKPQDRILQTIAHEMLHFMFYDYLDKVFPKAKSLPEEVIWGLSELFNTIILSQIEFKKIGVGNNFCYPKLKKYLHVTQRLWDNRNNLQHFFETSFTYLN